MELCFQTTTTTVCSTPESTATDSGGNFEPLGGTGPLVAYGGTDTSTGLPFKGTLEAPAGSTAITPLTTLIELLQAQGVSDPQAPVLASFGISPLVDLTTFDPIAAIAAGDADGGAAEVAGAEVYDAVSLIASGLTGAGGDFGTGANDAFGAIASALNDGGIDFTDQSALSGLISAIAQTEGLSLDQNTADSIASVIAASNVALGQKVLADGSGEQLVLDTAAAELVSQGPASNAIAQAGNDPNRLQSVITAFTGANLDGLTTAALSQLGSTDDDTGEQAALTLTIGPTLIGSAAATMVPFEIAGLDLEDTGTVTFTDPNGNMVTVNVNGGQTSYTADLSSLADGAITSSLAVNTDPAGNTFTPVAGTIVTLDQDIGEQAVLKLTVLNTSINAATAPAVAFTIAGLDAEDMGTVTFTDVNKQTVTVQVTGGQTTYTANLGSLVDGTITSSLAVSADPAGNAFTPVAGPKLTLSQLDHWVKSASGNWTTATDWSNGVPSSTLDAVVDSSGTYTVALSNSDSAYGLIVNDASATVADNSGGTLTLGGGSGALTITKGTFQLNGGALKAGSISTVPGGTLLIANSQHYNGANSLGEQITDNGAVTIQNSSAASMTGNISGSGALTIQNSSTGNLMGSMSGSEAILVQNSSTATFGSLTGSEVLTVKNSSKVAVSDAVSGSESFVITNSAQLMLGSAVNITGSFNLANSSTLEFGSSDNANVAFGAGSSTLRIDHSLTAPFTGALSGLTPNDTIDLLDLNWVKGDMTASFSGNATGGTVVVSNGSTSVSLKLAGDYTHATWTLSKDANGGTNVVDPPGKSNDANSISMLYNSAPIGYGATFEVSEPSASGRATVIDPTIPSTLWPDSPLGWLEHHVPSVVSDLAGFEHGNGFPQLLNQIENWNSAPGSGFSPTGNNLNPPWTQPIVPVAVFDAGWQSHMIQTMASFEGSKGGPPQAGPIQTNDQAAQVVLAGNTPYHN
jgi:hypothetical protein